MRRAHTHLSILVDIKFIHDFSGNVLIGDGAGAARGNPRLTDVLKSSSVSARGRMNEED